MGRYAISDKCELHSVVLDKYDRRLRHASYGTSSSSSRSSRASSAPPPELQEADEKKSMNTERHMSLPPTQSSEDMENLNMTSKIKLAREVEIDISESLRSVLGEEESTKEC